MSTLTVAQAPDWEWWDENNPAMAIIHGQVVCQIGSSVYEVQLDELENAALWAYCKAVHAGIGTRVEFEELRQALGRNPYIKKVLDYFYPPDSRLDYANGETQ